MMVLQKDKMHVEKLMDRAEHLARLIDQRAKAVEAAGGDPEVDAQCLRWQAKAETVLAQIDEYSAALGVDL